MGQNVPDIQGGFCARRPSGKGVACEGSGTWILFWE